MNDPGADIRDRNGLPFPLSALAELWPLDGWREVVRVPGGRNEHLRVTTGDGVYFLRRSYRSKSLDELTPQLLLMRLLRLRGLPVPVPVSNTEGLQWAEVEGRLWVMTRALSGSPYDGSPGHLRALGLTMAHYHHTVADLPGGNVEPRPLVELRERVAGLEAGSALTERAEQVVEELSALSPELPRLIVHGGARGSSLLFAGDEVVGILAFDNAHPDVRVLDLAVAVQDVGKGSLSPGVDDQSGDLDLDRVADLLSAYCETGYLTLTEAAALPLMIEATRLRGALSRIPRQREGEPLSVSDRARIDRERSRLRWLDDHRRDLELICAARAR
ncbi:MAG: phosphotransferase [Pseudonocardia sp.]